MIKTEITLCVKNPEQADVTTKIFGGHIQYAIRIAIERFWKLKLSKTATVKSVEATAGGYNVTISYEKKGG